VTRDKYYSSFSSLTHVLLSSLIRVLLASLMTIMKKRGENARLKKQFESMNKLVNKKMLKR
jgi:hypothetical protein